MEERGVRHDAYDERERISLGSVACAEGVQTKGRGNASIGGEGEGEKGVR